MESLDRRPLPAFGDQGVVSDLIQQSDRRLHRLDASAFSTRHVENRGVFGDTERSFRFRDE